MEKIKTLWKSFELSGLFSGDFSPLVSKPFKKEELLEKMKLVMNKEFTKVIDGYKRISIDRFLTFNKCFVGLIKIGDNKMLKVVNKDDEISEELLYNIVVKGVKYLYIERMNMKLLWNQRCPKLWKNFLIGMPTRLKS